MADEVVQADDGEDGGAQRQHDLEEVAEVAQAVDLRRVMQLLRNGGFEEGACHDHVVHGDRARQDKHPHGVVDAEGLVQQVVRDQATADEHGDGEQEHDDATRLEFAAGQCKSAGDGHGHVDRGADHRVDDRVEIALPDAMVGEHLRIAGEGHALRQQ